MKLDWRGKGIDEQGVDARTGKTVVKVDPRYFRPDRSGNAAGRSDQGAHQARAGAPTIGFDQLVADMIAGDLEHARRDALVAREGFKTYRRTNESEAVARSSSPAIGAWSDRPLCVGCARWISSNLLLRERARTGSDSTGGRRQLVCHSSPGIS